MPQSSLRIEPATGERADRLLAAVTATVTENILARKVTRTDILRMALEEGFTVLEARYGKTAPINVDDFALNAIRKAGYVYRDGSWYAPDGRGPYATTAAAIAAFEAPMSGLKDMP